MDGDGDTGPADHDPGLAWHRPSDGVTFKEIRPVATSTGYLTGILREEWKLDLLRCGDGSRSLEFRRKYGRGTFVPTLRENPWPAAHA